MYKLQNNLFSSDMNGYAVRGVRITDGGAMFGFYAPSVDAVYVTGSFNGWSESVPMTAAGNGMWTARAAASVGDTYKYKVFKNGKAVYVTDPYSRLIEHFGYHNSVICDSKMCKWGDEEWQRRNARFEFDKKPLNVYAVDLCAWQRGSDFCGKPSCELISYIKQMSYTHVELLGVLEHFYDYALEKGSVAAFAPRFELGFPSDLAELINALHVNGIGAILDISELDGIDADTVADCIEFWTVEYHFDGISLRSDMLERAIPELRERKGLRNAMLLTKRLDDECQRAAYVTDAFTVCRIKANTCDKLELTDSFAGVCSDNVRYAMLKYCDSLFATGKKLTYMGDELGARLNGAASERNDGAYLQLFCADINFLYLNHPRLWQDNGYITLYRSNGITAILRTSEEKNALLAIFNRSAESSFSATVKSHTSASFDVIFDSESGRYGGVHEVGAICREKDGIDLPPLSVKIFEFNGQCDADDIQIEIK